MPDSRKLQDFRVCRVFFSSPFGGMEDEREILTRKYFPQIHHLCNSHGVQFVPVDMRWGITKEAGENAQVINICLRELDRSDMFVGFFGQRYGWHGQEDQLLQQNIDNSVGRYPWIDKCRHLSVTAIEFLHGHLNNPGKHPACFAFRSKDYDDKLRQEGEKEGNKTQIFKYSSESDYAAKMLDELKFKIINSKDKLLGVSVDYNNPEECAKFLFDTIWNYMTKEVLVREVDLTEGMRQLAEHDAYLSARVSIYLQGDEYINRLDNALYSDPDPQPFLILGDVGSGKSALLSNWIHKHRNDDNDNIIWNYHFVGAASGSTAPKQILNRLNNDLKRVIEGEVEEKEDKSGGASDPETDDGVWKLLEKLDLLFRKAVHQDKKVVIVIDGLNKIQQARKIMKAYYWIPKDLPKGVFMVVSTSISDQAAHEIFVLQEKYEVLKIQPLDNETKKELCVKSLKESGKELSPHQLRKMLDARLTNNPLYLMIVLWELSVFGSFRLLDDKIDSLLEADSVTGLFVKYLERLEEDYNTDETGSNFVQQVMSCMILSNKGISDNEIQSVFNITSHGWSPLYFALEKFTISHFGLLKLGFLELQQAVQERYLKNNESFQNKLCLKLIDYFENKRKDFALLSLAEVKKNANMERIANELPHLQKLVNDKEGLLRSIVDQHIFHTRIMQERYELLDLVYFTGFPYEKIAELFIKSFDMYLTNVYLKKLENGTLNDQDEKAPGEKCMHSLRNMSIIMELAGHFKGYEMLMNRMIRLLENLEGKMLDTKRLTELMEAQYYMACNYADNEQYDKALDLHNKVVDTLKRIKKEKEISKDQNQVLAFATHGIGVVYLKKRFLDESRNYFLKSIEIHKENKDSHQKRHLAEATINLGLVELYEKNYDKALENFNYSLKAYEEIYFGQQPHELGNLYTNIGLTYRRMKNYDMAEKMYQKSLVIKANAVGWDNPVIAVTFMNLGTLEMFRKNYDKAVEYNQKCIDVIVKNNRTEEDMYYRMALENILMANVKAKKLKEALPAYRQVYDILTRLNQMDNCLPGAHRAMVEYLMEQGEVQEAEEKLIGFINCAKSKASEYITLHYLDFDKPVDKRPKRPYKLTLDYALERFPKDTDLYEAIIERDFAVDDYDSIDEVKLLQFLSERKTDLYHTAAYKLATRHDKESLKTKLEKLTSERENNSESLNLEGPG